MCGIAGCWRSDWNVAEALELIEHRGPDGSGVYVDGDAVHGHVRLAIQDPLPRSNQPFRFESITLSFVGEIWNWPELRQEMLLTRGYDFQTSGDTEVVAAALHTWGIGALQRLDGMFALAWTDGAGQTFVARDRFGKVPLYVRSGDPDDLFGPRLEWASERRAWGDEAWEAAAIPPGCYLEAGIGAIVPFYGLPEQPFGGWHVPIKAQGVLEELEEATRVRLHMADVPVCCLLSGGLDSSLTLALAKELKPDVVAYTAHLEGHPSGDLEAAIEVADELDVPLEIVEVPYPSLVSVYEAIGAIEIAMKAQVEIALLCLPLARRVAADGFKVVLSGEGADELFGGYGNLMRHSQDDWAWFDARKASFEKQARGNFLRVNKTFMRYGVEGRLPFLSRRLTEAVLPLGVDDCPPGKKLLLAAAKGVAPEAARSRRKATFQGNSGMAEACGELFKGDPTAQYNSIARELFGGQIPRG